MAPCMSATGSGLSDEDLVGRIRTGDRAAYDRAWDVLYDRWFPRMRSLCFLAIGAEHADDVAQDILLKCARGIRTFRGDSSFSTWLHRIASNRIADKIREIVKARKREAVSDKDVEELLDGKVERETGAREPVTDREVRELVECCRRHAQRPASGDARRNRPAARGEDVQTDRGGVRLFFVGGPISLSGEGADGLGALVDLSRVPRPAAAGLAAVVVAAGAVAAPYYWRGGRRHAVRRPRRRAGGAGCRWRGRGWPEPEAAGPNRPRPACRVGEQPRSRGPHPPGQ